MLYNHNKKERFVRQTHVVIPECLYSHHHLSLARLHTHHTCDFETNIGDGVGSGKRCAADTECADLARLKATASVCRRFICAAQSMFYQNTSFSLVAFVKERRERRDG